MTKFNFHLTPLPDLICVLDRLSSIREQFCHLFRRLQEILPALVPHTVFITDFFTGLDTEQDIVGFHVRIIYVMDIVCGDQFDPSILMDAE